MHYGIHLFPTTHSIQPGELALAAEDRGFDSVWFSEHTHIPVKFLNSGEDRPALVDYYWQLYDPFVAVTFSLLGHQNDQDWYRRKPGDRAPPDHAGKAGGYHRSYLWRKVPFRHRVRVDP